ncbi:MAG: hypothetical protein J5737_02515 [Bacteroidales bacterium]|nr:hypothetical protein [Bacteroidales bacterium]
MRVETKHFAPFAVAILALIVSCCTSTSGVAGYWQKHDVTVTESNYREAEDCFAEFAELAATAPLEEGLAALDTLFNHLLADGVSYYVYSEWMVSAFHSILSPCRNPVLFAKAVERLSSDGIMSRGEVAPLMELAAKDMLNAPGSPCTLPELTDADGSPAPWSPGSETVFVLVNLDCATCVGALNALGGEPGEHVALCYGRTPAPEISGWEYRYSNRLGEIFDLEAAPFWFSVDAAGKVRTAYSPIPHKEFAIPEQL